MRSSAGHLQRYPALVDKRDRRPSCSVELPAWPPPLDEAGREWVARACAMATSDGRGRQRADTFKCQLEERMTALTGAKFAVATNSGTSALDLAVRYCLDQREGVVLASNYGHPASIRMAAESGRQVLVDIDPNSLCLSPEAVKGHCAHEQVACVITTHIAGQPAGLSALRQICDEHGALLIEDCAHAHGAQADVGAAGAVGDIGCFSFHWSKTVPAGEGGMLLTSNEDIFRWVWRRHDIGRDPGTLPYQYAGLGANLRMSEPCAAAALSRLERLSADLETKANAVKSVAAALPRDALLGPLALSANVLVHGYHFLPLAISERLLSDISVKRLHLRMIAEGVPCSRGWPQTLDEIIGADLLARRVETPHAWRAVESALWVDQRLLLADGGAAGLTAAIDSVIAGL